MSLTLPEVVARLHQLAVEDPVADARAAYTVALNLLGRVDSIDLDGLQDATAKALTPGGRVRALAMTPEEEREYELSCDTDVNPDEAFNSDFPARTA